jgi:hypothetical protein
MLMFPSVVAVDKLDRVEASSKLILAWASHTAVVASWASHTAVVAS